MTASGNGLMATQPVEVMLVKKLSPQAHLPVRGSEHAAGFDLAAAHAAVVPAGGKALVKTDCAIAVPAGTYARVAPRSGLAWKRMIDTGAGVIDYDYRGNVGVVLFNHGPEEFVVEPGDRIAQLILERISMAPALEVQELPETERGAGGFGSTGGSRSLQSALPVSEAAAKKVKLADQGADLTAQMLIFVSSLPDGVTASKADCDKLKLCALSDRSTRLLAAIRAYEATSNVAELQDNLRLILRTL
ncbi:deoxyuridine 5'-triphosphate nucleotidohydrolase [Tribonema minus]|uniref:Deoxyuridine 5'-triphosphate nucleotidohydrolase n=1 Tax=Tribonema minus TaxID=303371 RepID=A0A835YUJ2_9STRA|nr:deoxyuridine 5'-triphosphate nucleotidohydrolase [Tribonema minus]